ncbi:neurohypophysial n-terminal domain containing protein [Stylonychia lemnae]|uniref:Neurohypophysial n-terminal domain containing protein n=1 Tax=Stylonychia lemnae TaxID=5949 RepID=A0A077ZPR8_STYLE|nr:neurohypophysial n-terminal domain containing protein [Stylonychia lemnae]|eukprot:CDW71957.1 neurohypophysial n-terminal domain containing protein [Stylonychia lemnae]
MTALNVNTQPPNIEDTYTLRLNSNSPNYQVCYDNPLYNLEASKYGVYDVWFYIQYWDQWKMFDRGILMKFMYNSSYPASNSTWIIGRDRGYYTRKMSQNYPHPLKVCMWQMPADNSSMYIRQNEIKFFAYQNTEFYYFYHFIYRFYAQSYKLYTGVKPTYIVDYYRPKPQSSSLSGWTASINTNLKATFTDQSRVSWSDTDTLGENINYCMPGYHKNMSYWNCTQCDSPCFECSIWNSSFCYSCIKNYYPSEYYCYKADCPKGQFFNDTRKICQTCPAPCSSCNDEGQCLYCQAGYNYINNGSRLCLSNVDGCPKNTTLDSDGYRICQQCPQGCRTCNSSNYCYSCLTDYYLKNGTCLLNQCSMGKYQNSVSKQCQNCSTNCSSCSSNQCLKCYNGSYLDTTSGTCKLSCPIGTYQNQTSGTCQKCQSNCYYQNSNNRKCDKCKNSCLLCVTSETDCVSCKPGSLYSNRQCQDSCKDQEYASQAGFCYPCDPACKVCNGSLDSLCQKCNPGYYLQGSTCYKKCPTSYYPNLLAQTCESCKYYCDDCNQDNDCNICKSGYGFIKTLNCTGEYFYKSGLNRSLSLPFNTQTIPSDFDPEELTTELWFKAQDLMSIAIQVLLGLNPYKIRKISNDPIMQLQYQNTLQYCNSEPILKNNVWYHIAFTFSQKTLTLACYQDGNSVPVGLSPTIVVVQNLIKPEEMTLGGSKDLKSQETNFDGYIKEFRLWKIARTSFQIKNFRTVSFTIAPPDMIAYWRLDDKNDGSTQVFSEATSNQVITYDPQPILKIQDLVEFREIYLKLCQEGTYSYFNETLGYYICLPCDNMCKNCIGKTSSHCIECNLPYKLIKEEFICKIVEYCLEGEFMDKITGLCFKCNSNCKTCFNDSNNCQACKQGAFREYQGTSCVDTCPVGMYGNVKSQQCYFNPRIDYIIPASESIILFGSFIDVKGNFTMLNKEDKESYTYGWKVIRLSDNLDITVDAVKPYYETDIRKMHMDNNIIQAYNYYSLTLFVKGLPEFYNGLYAEMVNTFYVGSAPKNGKCQVFPFQGIATVTNFKIQQSGWVDEEIITRYDFLYSLDGGTEYFPIQTDNRLSQEISYQFQSIYDKFIEVRVMCKATNLKGFSSKITTLIVLEKKSNADASKDLSNINTLLQENEEDILQMIIQLKLITKQLGNTKTQDPQAFDPRLSSKDCNNKLCNNNGNCVYLNYQKKYYCNCTEPFAGLNCTYSNKTQLIQIKSFISQLSVKYLSLSDKQYEDIFLSLVSDYLETMNDVTFGIIIQIIGNQFSQNGQYPLTNKQVTYYMNLISNLIEYVENQVVQLNATRTLLNDEIKIQNLQDNYQSALDLFEYLRSNSLNQIDMLDPSKQFQSRMISYKQILISQDSLQQLSATQDLKKSLTTFIKISEINFKNQGLPLEQDFIFEAIEFAVNPYQVVNFENISNNVFEVSFYNASDKAKAEIKNLSNGFDFYFPHQDNQNLSEFITYYNSLSPYKAKQKALRSQLLQSSKLDCQYWNSHQWSNQGCHLQGVDKTHIKCNCNHLSSFSTTFMTPKQSSASAETYTNKYLKSNLDDDGKIKIEDLIVPFDKYFKNLEELLQHKTPSLIEFIFKPGIYIVLLFWLMYISSLFYYTGKDKIKREKMTKSQIRDDLAEIKDDKIQNLDELVKELLARDLNKNQGIQPQEISSQQTRQNSGEDRIKLKLNRLDYINQPKQVLLTSQNFTLDNLNIPTQIIGMGGNSPKLIIKNFEQLDEYQQKLIKRRARKRVFGRVGDVNERAKRLYKQIFKRKQFTPENKMKFFHEALKNNLWFSLMAKTSKIAPRHTRLTLLYLYISMHLSITSVVYIFGYQQLIADLIGDSTFSTLAIAILPLIAAWIICLPVALVFRMPMTLRRELEGVRAKKINKVFKEIDQLMGCRYALGYFISFTCFVIMTIIVIFFNYIYPTDYCMGWMMILVALYFLDMIIFTLGFAGFQLLNIILSLKCRFFYHIWALFEIIRYYKNLRG